MERDKIRKNKSYIRKKWAAKQARKNKRIGYVPPMRRMFQEIIIAITYFAEHRNASKNTDMDKVYKEISNRLQGDSSLFEVSCYVYYKIGVWLLRTNPKNLKQDVFLEGLANNFIDLFKVALPKSNINTLFFERVQGYTKAVEKDKCHFCLIELLKRTANNIPPTEYKFGEEPIMLSDIFEELALKMYVGAFEVGMLPVIIKSVAKVMVDYE